MHMASSRLLPAAVVLLTWGIVGLLQKLSTNYLSAETALIWLVVGYFLLLPWLYPAKSVFAYSTRNLLLTMLSAGLNTLGAWALLAAMKNGGKASIVVPLTALYPIVVVLLGPLVLKETITRLQGVGVLCALVSCFYFPRRSYCLPGDPQRNPVRHWTSRSAACLCPRTSARLTLLTRASAPNTHRHLRTLHHEFLDSPFDRRFDYPIVLEVAFLGFNLIYPDAVDRRQPAQVPLTGVAEESLSENMLRRSHSVGSLRVQASQDYSLPKLTTSQETIGKPRHRQRPSHDREPIRGEAGLPIARCNECSRANLIWAPVALNV